MEYNRKRKTQRGGRHKNFWNKEYKTSEHLALSTNPSEDLMKFCRWHEREFGAAIGRFNSPDNVLDLGCGNGRNLIYLAKEFGCSGVGFDISEEAVLQAEEASVGELGEENAISFTVGSMTEPLPYENGSFDLLLDMMSSHFLHKNEREALCGEILRVLKPQGWFFFKGFLAEGDLHVKRLLKEHPADEPNGYIHPKLGVFEYVWTEKTLREFFGSHFEIHKLDKSHKHLLHGRAFKRRTVSAYLQKR